MTIFPKSQKGKAIVIVILGVTPFTKVLVNQALRDIFCFVTLSAIEMFKPKNRGMSFQSLTQMEFIIPKQRNNKRINIF